MIVAAIAGWSAPVYSCTTVGLMSTQSKIVANTLDWSVGHGKILINPRQVSKTAYVSESASSALVWTSKYGSLTLNQLGREFPYGGINEKGLVVEIMQLEGSVPEPTVIGDARPTINEVQWIQWLLDSAATTEEALSLAQSVRIVRAVAPVHYMICDAGGACATVELIGGKSVVHADLGSRSSPPALTNNTYDESLEYLKKFERFGGSKTVPLNGWPHGSLDRFVIAADGAVKASAGNENVADGFKLLEFAMGIDTQWKTVYELAVPALNFKLRKSNAAKPARRIVLAGLNWSCLESPQGLDMSTAQAGAGFSMFGDAENAAWVDKSFFVSKGFRSIMAHYPERSTRCLD